MNDLKLSDAHTYIQMWLHAMVAERNQEEIRKYITDYYKDEMESLFILEDDVDLAYLLKLPGKIVLSISGTRDEDGWGRNAKFRAVDGWHRGFKKSFLDLIQKPLDSFLRRYRDPIYITGHSAGSAVALNANFYVRSNYARKCESITFCGPQAVDRIGVEQCRKQKVCNTTLNVGIHDIVDNVTELVGGKNYGKIVTLPDAGKPNVINNEIADAIVGGHAPSYVTRCMQKLFVDWGKPEQVKYLEMIAPVAIR